MAKNSTAGKAEKATPLMAQYEQVKAKYPETILLFRIGDFYETFGKDAIKAAEILGIVLTKRRNGAASEIELAGFPHHALNAYLPKLVRAGQRVAVCDQLEDPKQAKGVVKRGVTDIVTPGIAYDEQLLDHGRANYLAALNFHSGSQVGAAFVEVSTGEFFCFSGTTEEVEKLLYSLKPAELVAARKDIASVRNSFGEDFYVFRLEDWAFEPGYAKEQLLRHFRVSNLKGFALEDEPLGTIAAGVLLHYLAENEQHELHHITRIYRFREQRHLMLDKFTIRNLELLEPLFPDGEAFVDGLDATRTSMGGRLLRQWVIFPLREQAAIEGRLAKVETLLQERGLRPKLAEELGGMSDLERLLSRLATGKLAPREALSLRRTLERTAPLWEQLEGNEMVAAAFKDLLNERPDIAAPMELLLNRLQADASNQLGSGQVIAAGVSEELDELRSMRDNAEDVMAEMKEREVRRTGITSLKVGFNKVFGYYLEITHAHKDKVPEDYIRKQTLTNAERYITPELKSFEEKILSASERIQSLETELYRKLLEALQPHIEAMQTLARLVATVDVLQSLANVAERHRYVRPTLNLEGAIRISQGRHPVIERLLPPDSPYVPNDIQLNTEEQQILLVTGPNMAGKSALLRQTALITLMAQFGSFVPADAAEIGLVDQIFTRVGASDNLSAGESTFMVEMNEAARIANTASARSLILLDEIGRGTSTYDGVSIAWALVEYLHNELGAKTLFATHYHELATLGEQLPRVRNVNVRVEEVQGRIIFLRKLEEGHSAHSFGINVAAMAGLPPSVVNRAKELLAKFESHSMTDAPATEDVQALEQQPAAPQLDLFSVEDAPTRQAKEMLRGLDINRLTPVEALLKLQELQSLLQPNGQQTESP